MLSHILFPKLMTPFAFSRVAFRFGDVLTQYMLHIRATGRATYQTHWIQTAQSVITAISRYLGGPCEIKPLKCAKFLFSDFCQCKTWTNLLPPNFLSTSYFLVNTKNSENTWTVGSNSCNLNLYCWAKPLSYIKDYIHFSFYNIYKPNPLRIQQEKMYGWCLSQLLISSQWIHICYVSGSR